MNGLHGSFKFLQLKLNTLYVNKHDETCKSKQKEAYRQRNMREFDSNVNILYSTGGPIYFLSQTNLQVEVVIPTQLIKRIPRSFKNFGSIK